MMMIMMIMITVPRYSEACSSTMATTYSSGSSGERKVIATIIVFIDIFIIYIVIR